MSSWVVVDTSVMFKWFLAYGESGLDEAWQLRREHEEGSCTIAAPASSVLELANLLSYTGIGVQDARAFMNAFAQVHIRIFETTFDRSALAIACAYEHRISVYDAAFLALAQELHCPLATADRRAFGAIPPEAATVRLLL